MRVAASSPAWFTLRALSRKSRCFWVRAMRFLGGVLVLLLPLFFVVSVGLALLECTFRGVSGLVEMLRRACCWCWASRRGTRCLGHAGA